MLRMTLLYNMVVHTNPQEVWASTGKKEVLPLIPRQRVECRLRQHLEASTHPMSLSYEVLEIRGVAGSLRCPRHNVNSVDVVQSPLLMKQAMNCLLWDFDER